MPSYEIVVYNDASARYVGKHFVNLRGTADAKISNEELQALVGLAERLEFSKLSADYTSAFIADAGLVELTYWVNGIARTVRFQPAGGDAPIELAGLAAAIDSAVQSKHWICPLPRFSEMFCK